jgi:ADP-ribose pyrophosphatase
MTRKIEILARERVHDGFFKVDRYRLRQTGVLGAFDLTRELFERGASAAILLWDPAFDEVLVVEEFRIGLLGAGFPPEECWSPGPIAGVVDKGEAPLASVLREAREEAGIEITAEDILGEPMTILPSPGGSSEVVHLFIAKADLHGMIDAIFGLGSEAEETLRRVRPRAEVLAEVLAKPASGHLTSLMLRLEMLRHPGIAHAKLEKWRKTATIRKA